DQSEALSLSDRLAVMAEGQIRQVGTPQEIYTNPADRFVASFIGDVNVIPARVESLSDGHALIRAGQARVRVPRQHLGQLASEAQVDLFVRPEQLRLAEDCEAPALRGTVHAQIFQGGHTDVLVDIRGVAQGPVLVRLPGPAQSGRWRVGSPIDIA